ncbi:hypothetical protein FOZ61_000927 [Perkinsus olseni]|uniref:J domain-containing protein n=1 Tax=Perkinsus olseni TaxID=32597 RepID=A0A7J6MFS5_PEROL|nr:hypothetical protein FOZ61_000927 [Perkinsus olseni]KAF4673999.1 hypothetical protein FOL46_006035 [Perkinsus olseni]
MNAKSQPPTLFEVLGVPPSANKQRIRRAYLDLSLRFHPNSIGAESDDTRQAAEEFFKTIKDAYDILSDSHLHACYLENMRFGSSAALVAVERARQGRAVNKRVDALQFYADALNLFPNLTQGSDPLAGDLPTGNATETHGPNLTRGLFAHPYARPQVPPSTSSRSPQYPLRPPMQQPGQQKQMQGELLLGVTLSSTGFYVYVYLGPGQFVRGPDRPTLFLAVSDGARLVRGMENRKIYEVLAVLLEEARQPWAVQTQGFGSMVPERATPGIYREGEASTNIASTNTTPSSWNQAAMSAGRHVAYPSTGGVNSTHPMPLNLQMGSLPNCPPSTGYGYNTNGGSGSLPRVPPLWETLSVKELIEMHGKDVWEFFPLEARRKFFNFAMRFYIPRERPHAAQPRSPPEFRGLPHHVFDAYVVMFFRYLKIVNDIETNIAQSEGGLERFPTHFPDGTAIDDYLMGEGMNFMRRYGQLYLIRLTIERLSTSDPTYLASVSQRITAQTRRTPPIWKEDPTWTWTETDDLKLLCSLEENGLGELVESSALVAGDSLRWPPSSIENPKFQSFIYARLQWLMNGLVGVSRVARGAVNRT